jgi:hypothetical protein
MKNVDGTPLVLDGLWALHTPGTKAVYFTAGIVEEEHGLFGFIQTSK